MTETSGTERKRGSGGKVVYEILRDEILDLTLRPGSPVDEVQLAERFSMSRTPIREALLRLSSEGLVETLPNRATIVAQIDMLGLHAFFDAITLSYRITNRLAALHHKPADIARLHELQARFADAVQQQDALGMIAANRDFHVAIAEAARNPYFLNMATRVLDDGRRLLRLYYQSFNDRLPSAYVDEHELIIAAIEARDVDEADRLAVAHGAQITNQIRRMVTGTSCDVMPL